MLSGLGSESELRIGTQHLADDFAISGLQMKLTDIQREWVKARGDFATRHHGDARLASKKSRLTSYLPITSITTRTACFSASVVKTGAGLGTTVDNPLAAPVDATAVTGVSINPSSGSSHPI